MHISLNRWVETLDYQAEDDFYCKKDHLEFAKLAIQVNGEQSALCWRAARAAYLGRFQTDRCCGFPVTFAKLSDHYNEQFENFLTLSIKVDKSNPHVKKMCAFFHWEKAIRSRDTADEVDAITKCKKTLDEVIPFLPLDAELYQLRGRLYYAISQVHWVDRALSFVTGIGQLPKATIEMALDDLMESNRLQSNNKLTCLLIAKVYICKKNIAAAKEWIITGIQTDKHGVEGCQTCRDLYKLVNEHGIKLKRY
ncbi:hypothetical protein HDE_10100 [Halotydeus destructor]|nr:hypothetical protein HDE_10100 [Halotydeus destructor]